LRESASGVSLRYMSWFTANDVRVDAVEVPKVRWRTQDEPLEQGLVKDENVAPNNVICVYVVGPDLS